MPDDLDALMRHIEAERRAREANERLDAWLDHLEAEPLSDEEVTHMVERVFADRGWPSCPWPRHADAQEGA